MCRKALCLPPHLGSLALGLATLRACAPHLPAAHPASPTVGRASSVQPPPPGPALAERLAHSISSGEESFSPTGLQAPGEGKICISTFTSLDLNTMPSTESGS